MRSQHLILPSLLVLACLFASTVARSSSGAISAGAWTPIKNISDPHVKEVADFALSEHNKQSGTNLKLVEIIKCETQVVAGTNYRLVLSAKDGFNTKNYVAILREKPTQKKSRNLTSFKPLAT